MITIGEAGRRTGSLAALALLALVAGSMPVAAQPPAERPSNCDRPLSEPIAFVAVPGRPLHPTPTRDGCWIFAAFVNRPSGAPSSGLAVLRRAGDGFEEVRTIPFSIPPQGLGGMALTRDQRILVASYGDGLMFFDVGRLTGGEGDALLGRLSGPRMAGSFGVTITPDDKYVLGVQRGTAWVAIVDLEKARASGFNEKALVGGIPTAPQPITPVVSIDGRLLYLTSLTPPDVVSGPRVCSGGKESEGAIQIVDARRAVSEPAAATIGFASPAGCTLNAMALSPDGTRLSNTFAGDIFSAATPLEENGLVAFDVRPVSAGKPPLPIGRVPLSRGPIWVVDDGRRIFVGFRENEKLPTPNAADITVIDASKLSAGKAAIVGTIPVAAGHLALSGDGHTLLGAVWGGKLAIIDLERIRLQPVTR